jgi:hypothetical protein
VQHATAAVLNITQPTAHQKDIDMKKILIALMMSCVGSAAFAANFVTEGPKPNELVDTGWLCSDNATSHKLVMKHGIGSTPRFYTLAARCMVCGTPTTNNGQTLPPDAFAPS